MDVQAIDVTPIMSPAAVLLLPIDDLPEDDSEELLAVTVGRVFAAWQKAAGKPRAKLNDIRRNLIALRLRQGYTEDDLVAAVRGWQYDAWCAGDNPTGQQYNGLEYLLRVNMQGNNIERFAELYDATRALNEDERQ